MFRIIYVNGLISEVNRQLPDILWNYLNSTKITDQKIIIVFPNFCSTPTSVRYQKDTWQEIYWKFDNFSPFQNFFSLIAIILFKFISFLCFSFLIFAFEFLVKCFSLILTVTTKRNHETSIVYNNLTLSPTPYQNGLMTTSENKGYRNI